MKYCLSILPEIDAMLRSDGRILIATDFDGTLCPISESPAEVKLAPATVEILRHVAICPRVKLAVISGRALSDVRRKVPVDIIFAGNHGLEIAGGGLEFVHDGALQLRPSLEEACLVLREAIREWPGAWVEDKLLSATLHFRRVDPRHHSSLLFTARRRIGAFGPKLALRMGNRALEIRPKVEWDKGTALRYIQQGAGPFDACICLGDDRTDESMFRANLEQLNISVGRPRGTVANHYLSDSADVTVLLSHIADVCSSPARSSWRELASSGQAAEIGPR